MNDLTDYDMDVVRLALPIARARLQRIAKKLGPAAASPDGRGIHTQQQAQAYLDETQKMLDGIAIVLRKLGTSPPGGARA